MSPRHNILLCVSNEFRAAELRMVMELRLQVKVTVAKCGTEAVTALDGNDFRCAVIVKPTVGLIDYLRVKEVPTIEIGSAPSYADRVIGGNYMAEILEAVRMMCVRKRGPRKQVAA